MRMGMVGLGRMGGNMVRRLLRTDIEVAAWNRTPSRVQELAREGALPAGNLSELVGLLPAPRVVWCMLPAGAATEERLDELAALLSPGDVLVDGGNSRHTDDPVRAERFGGQGIHYMDVGVSGGVWGLTEGYCCMVGGSEQGYNLLEPFLLALAPAGGVMHCGPSGAGHFVKMIHNGIEYGMMQAYAEGFALLEGSAYAEGLDYAELARLWNRGSVIRSWLLELAGRAFEQSPRLEELRPWVDDSGEGRWTVEQALESGTPAPVLTLALMERFRSRTENSFADRLLAALRNEFGGHSVRRREEGE